MTDAKKMFLNNIFQISILIFILKNIALNIYLKNILKIFKKNLKKIFEYTEKHK